MRLRALALLIGLACLFPLGVHAKQSLTWDLRDPQAIKSWDIAQWSSATQTTEGLHISTTTEGRMVRLNDATFPIDSLTINFVRPKPVKATLFWHPHFLPEGQVVQLPFLIEGEQARETAAIDMTIFKDWDPHTDFFGLLLPAGSDVIVESVTADHWNAFEKIGQAWKSFWTFDSVQAYTINFLWGPLLSFTDAGRARLYGSLPPPSMSANRVFYGVILVVALLLAAHAVFLRWTGRRMPRLRRGWLGGLSLHLGLFLALLAGLWVFYDLRMGTEVIVYAKRDAETYIFQEPGKRTLRGYINFADVMELSLPYLQERPYFGFLSPPQTPFTAHMRYFAYPSLPVERNGSLDGVNTWLIFYRSDVSVDGDGYLNFNSQRIAGPGKILRRFDDVSFLYRTNN